MKENCVLQAQIKSIVQNLQGCRDLGTATTTHSAILKSGLSTHTFPANHLLNAYLRLDRIIDACRLFDEMPHRNVVSWTALMAGYVDAGRPQEALRLLGRMGDGRIRPNEFTLATAVNASSVLADIETGRKIHAQVETWGFRLNNVVCTALVDMYGKCNEVDNARRVFDDITNRNVISWTSMISTYAQNAQGDDALNLFRELMHEKSSYLMPNQFTFASALNACASLGRMGAGKAMHGAAIHQGHDLNDVVASALIDMYSKCGCIHYSDKVFRRIDNPSLIPLTSMIVGMARHGMGMHSLHMFDDMLAKGIIPNGVTILGVLYACSHSGLIEIGLDHFKSMQERHGIVPYPKHYACVVDMLGRSGRLDEAYKLSLESAPQESKDAALMWSSLLSACKNYGRLDIAIEASRRLVALNEQVASTYVTMSNMCALAEKWVDVREIRAEMKRQGIRKEPGCSWIEVKDSTYVFYAGDLVSCVHGEEIERLLRELEERMRERGYGGGSGRVMFFDINEDDAKEESARLHSERLALCFGLMKLPKGITIRVMKNLRMCEECHEAFKLISDIVGRVLVVRDVNRFHHFKDGSCNCGDYW